MSVTPLQLQELEKAYRAGISLRAIASAKHLTECPPCRNQFLDGSVKISRPSSSEILGAPREVHDRGCICEQCYRALQPAEPVAALKPYRRGPMAMVIAFAVFFVICFVLLLASPVMLVDHVARH